MKMLMACACGWWALIFIVHAREYPPQWGFSEPPVGDEFLTNRFGRTWSEPIYSGYLVVDDHYVDAPYVVEQRGFVIMVNGERVDDAVDIRMVLPPPEPEPVTIEPGPIPAEFTHDTSLYQVLEHPFDLKYRLYWDYLGMQGQGRIDACVRYYRSLPCISNVVDTGKSDIRGTRVLQITDNRGLSLKCFIGLEPNKKIVHEDKGLYLADVQSAFANRQMSFRNNRYLRIRNAGVLVNGPAPETDELAQWYAGCKTLAAVELTATQRFERLQFLHMIGKDESMRSCDMIYPLYGFHTSSQLWQRLSGDMSWTNDAPARLLALTNGWQQIPPAFMRTQVVTVATVPGASTRDDGTGAVGRATTRIGPSAGLDSAAPGSGQTTSDARPGNAKLLLVLALVGGLAGVFVIARRLIRK
jgi:hypothetical protein